MGEQIKHTGEVVSISGRHARVRIVQTSACSACHAKSMCMASESKEKFIDAQMLDSLAVGDACEVLVEQSIGWKAVLIAFVLPFLLMLGVLLLCRMFWSEAISGTLAVVAVGGYALVLSGFRNKLQKTFRFFVRKLDN